jgi:Flp pilus assembly protein TadG
VAVVLPVFLAFVFGLIEIGRVGMVVNLLNSASRSAARYGATEGITSAQAENRLLLMVESIINRNLVNVEIKDASVFDGTGPYPTTPQAFQSLPDIELSETPPRHAILVEASVDYNDIAILRFPFMQGVTLYGRAVMRHE